MKRLSLTAAALAALGVGVIAAPSPAAAQVQSRDCNPTEVAVFSNRIHVRCAPIPSKAYTSDIPYYAMKLAGGDGRQVRMTLELMSEAKANGRKLRIWADMSDYKSVPGCQGSNCRRLTGVAMK